ncbi:MAG: hypothetical protein PHD37_16870 [Gallionellaceae bacterium]|nr:hypothetical protein [Gallionellaceae bacterium]
MSKLEDKLTASIKPGQRKAPAGKPEAPAAAAPVPVAKASVKAVVLDTAALPHPDRVWPD